MSLINPNGGGMEYARTFLDGYIYMKKGVWRSEISWLLLIHYELLENEESFYRFLTVLLNIDWNYFNVTKFYKEWKTKGILNCKCLQWEMNQIYKNYVREGLKKMWKIPRLAEIFWTHFPSIQKTRTTNVVRNAGCAHSRYTLNFFKSMN